MSSIERKYQYEIDDLKSENAKLREDNNISLALVTAQNKVAKVYERANAQLRELLAECKDFVSACRYGAGPSLLDKLKADSQDIYERIEETLK